VVRGSGCWVSGEVLCSWLQRDGLGRRWTDSGGGFVGGAGAAGREPWRTTVDLGRRRGSAVLLDGACAGADGGRWRRILRRPPELRRTGTRAAVAAPVAGATRAEEDGGRRRSEEDGEAGGGRQ
jgi:hypothetical protein